MSGRSHSKGIPPVWQVCDSDGKGGAAVAADRLNEGLRRIGWESGLAVWRRETGAGFLIPQDDGDARRMRDAALLGGNYFGARRTGALSNTVFSVDPLGVSSRAVTALGAPIINLHWVAGLLVPAEIRALVQAGSKLVWTLHDMRPFTGGCHFSNGCLRFRDSCTPCPQLTDDPAELTRWQLDEVHRQLLDLPWTAVSPSRWLADLFRSSPLGQGRRTEVIPNGLDHEVFRPTDRAQACVRLKLDPDVRYLCLGAAWMNEKRKGALRAEAVLRTLASLPEAEENIRAGRWRLLTFGRNSSVVDAGLWTTTSLGLIESEEGMSEMYSVADVLLFTSLEDNLPNVIAEAMSCGLPIVGFESGGVGEMVDELTGFLVPKDGEREAARRCCELLSDAGLRMRLGAASRARICADYRLEDQARSYASLYEQALTEPPPAVQTSACSDAYPGVALLEALRVVEMKRNSLEVESSRQIAKLRAKLESLLVKPSLKRFLERKIGELTAKASKAK